MKYFLGMSVLFSLIGCYREVHVERSAASKIKYCTQQCEVRDAKFDHVGIFSGDCYCTKDN